MKAKEAKRIAEENSVETRQLARVWSLIGMSARSGLFNAEIYFDLGPGAIRTLRDNGYSVRKCWIFELPNYLVTWNE